MAGKHGVNMLLSQYKNSENLKKYVSIIVSEFEEVRKAQEDSIKYRYLADSFGVMVDDIAYLVGASRVIYGAVALGYFGFYSNPGAHPAGDDNNPNIGGILKSDSDKDSGDFVRTDTQLKQAIRARIIKIMGNCNVEQLITYTELVLGRTIDLEVREGHQTIDYIVHGTLSVDDKVLLSYMLPDFKPAGIAITLADNSGDIALVYVSKIYPPEK
ncbi:baseplate wedge protein [Escherichia phage vB_EcoM_4HA13]|uniref:Baseplate wedge protein n=1 Tax=Escherichia phage vB_EcoM_4HA13 TaxID=2601675 RepID=A0A7D0N9N8_9CAUD|nr:structural protein [Escherichia phage vB_EcoM_4HA13]QEM43049.1 baseplate wedge protein [Escherichia phage vB_EcoM_4HA13]